MTINKSQYLGLFLNIHFQLWTPQSDCSHMHVLSIRKLSTAPLSKAQTLHSPSLQFSVLKCLRTIQRSITPWAPLMFSQVRPSLRLSMLLVYHRLTTELLIRFTSIISLNLLAALCHRYNVPFVCVHMCGEVGGYGLSASGVIHHF